MATQNPYAGMRRQFEEIIAGLSLQDIQKQYLTSRWLEQLLWFDSKAAMNQRRSAAARWAASDSSVGVSPGLLESRVWQVGPVKSGT